MKSGTTVILGDGDIRVIDPDMSMLDYLKRLDPDFEIVSDPPPQGFVPGFQVLRRSFIPELTGEELAEMGTDMMWAVHNSVINGKIPLRDRGEVSVLALKRELGHRILARCELCGFKCGANRYREKGRCGAGAEAVMSGLFEHISEEHQINPAWNVVLASCPLRCVFCQAPENHAPGKDLRGLSPELWETIKGSTTAQSIEFVGGEPMVSVPGILDFLSAAPAGFSLPVVMNCSAYLGKAGICLMNGVVDVWLPDVSFANDICAKRLCGAENYWEKTKESLSLIFQQQARVIVRILVLPGHFECCHRKALDWLSQYRDSIRVSIMDQYLPFHEAYKYEDINRPPTGEEIKGVRLYARKNGLRDVNDEEPGLFWTG